MGPLRSRTARTRGLAAEGKGGGAGTAAASLPVGTPVPPRDSCVISGEDTGTAPRQLRYRPETAPSRPG